MTPTCAICLLPLTRGQFLILRTQVIHKTCERSSSSTELERVRRAEADARRATRQALTQLAEVVAQASRAQRDRDALRNELTRIERQRDAAIRDRLAAIRARNDAITDRDEARRGRDAAQAELARLLASQEAVALAVPDSPKAEQDPVALRFSLLDMD